MAEVQRERVVTDGDWRTLESGWNTTFSCIFYGPAGARVKVRYGDGRWRGRNSQLQTLDGNRRMLTVGQASFAYARVQIRVKADTTVHYTYVTTGPEPPEDPIP
jgi:hypothetical protein